MAEIPISDVRRHGGEVVDRASRGETITITRAGRLVAKLRPVRPPFPAEALLSRWRWLPDVDPRRLRNDLRDL